VKRATTRPRGYILSWHPQAKTRERLAQVKQVLKTYVSYLPLTCRQIFYSLVGVYDYPKTERSYQNLCETLNIARRARVLDFEHIRDDDAPVPGYVGWEDAREFIEATSIQAGRLRLDRQARNLPNPFVAVLCEAAGMVPQLERVAEGFSVPVLGSGGFDSLTFKHIFARWAAGLDRLVEVLHIGDHDPSGVHVFTSFAEDVAQLAAPFGGSVAFSRLAVTPEQALLWRLPTKPRKATDRRRFAGIGDDPNATVQVEAVPPDVLGELLRRELALRIPDEVLRRTDAEKMVTRRSLTRGFARLLPPPDRSPPP
jgi:hypothetical protein